MADPLTIIGAASAIASIIEVAGRTIKMLCDLHTHWRHADLTLLNLMGQLVALRAALGKIRDWLDGTDDTSEQHHQLTMDLDLSMTCCRTLVEKMNALTAGLIRDASDASLDVGSKIKFVFGSGTSEDLQKMLERQVSALTLLLTACNCNALLKQKFLLQSSSSRKILNRVKQDTASLYVHRDTTSLYSRCTDTLSKMSVLFNFDRDLLATKVYERAFRGALKATLHRKLKPNSRDGECGDDVLVLGGGYEDQVQLITQLKTFPQKPNTTDPLCLPKFGPKSSLIAAMRTVTKHVQNYPPVQLDNVDFQNVNIVSHELEGIWLEAGKDQITPSALKAMNELWKSRGFLEYFHETFAFDSHIYYRATYLFDKMDRIGGPDYIPVAADLDETWRVYSGMQDVSFNAGPLKFRVLLDNQHSERKKWIHQFDDSKNIIFMVDMSCYNQVSMEDGTQTQLMEDLATFEFILNSATFMRTCVILLLTNRTHFEQKLATDPLTNHFQEYDSNDGDCAAKYLLSRFNQINRTDQSINSHIVDKVDFSTIRLVYADMSNLTLEKMLDGIWFV